jgi:hypothetical protein
MLSGMVVAIIAEAKVSARVKKNSKLAASGMSDPIIRDCRFAMSLCRLFMHHVTWRMA